MLTTPVITAEEGARLNKKAALIDRRLFWVCNYEPTKIYVFSEDGYFLLGIQDLYKFAIDANCILRGFAFGGANQICEGILDEEEVSCLSSLVNLVQSFRSAIDHNQSEQNGVLLSKNEKAFENWLASKLGKESPENVQDFAVLNEGLRNIGKDLVQFSNTILERLAERPDRDDIVTKWVKITLKWYCTGTHRDYYRSQLGECYVYRSYLRNSRSNVGQNTQELYRKVNRWIKRQVTYELDSEIKSLREAKERPSSQELSMREKFPELYSTAITHRDKQIQELEEKLSELEDSIQRHYEGDKVECYFANLIDQLASTMEILEQNGEQYTLLPQDLLYMDAMRVFGRIGSPDGDFR